MIFLLLLITTFSIQVHCSKVPGERRLLNDGYTIPPVALGTFMPTSQFHLAEAAVIHAIESGFRHIDTASLYLTEEYVGRAVANVISRGIVKREDLFITTKLDITAESREDVLPSIQCSLRRLQLDYVDLYLVHTPVNLVTEEEVDILGIWDGMQEVRNLGLTKSIGVCNFNSTQINKLLAYSYVPPAVSQTEVNPTFASLDLVAYCQSMGIQVMAYAPLGYLVPRPFRNNTLTPTLEDPLMMGIPNKYGKTSIQVAIRYLIQRGTIPIPKSVTFKHIQSNIDVFDFSLSRDDVLKINAFDRNTQVYGFSPTILESVMQYTYNIGFQELFDKFANLTDCYSILGNYGCSD